MKTLQQQLGQYGLYHRSRRNVLTHFFGIPLIVFALICLLARIQFTVGGASVDGAHVFVLVLVIYYLALSVSLGCIMALLLALLAFAAQPIVSMPFASWLALSVGLFVVGWVLQFIGHYYEANKPAFVDDLVGLIIGPLYVVAEMLFLMGFYIDLEHQVNDIAGQPKA